MLIIQQEQIELIKSDINNFFTLFKKRLPFQINAVLSNFLFKES